ncbi:hypothetical protein DPEC_G00278310 [Dallia pectoralis]|uniref:Uncharacterized protein n=1 Tax=Dallia pectoralis TaxID=75939 RepID=A0ACC2FM69_DALPE|nr:hypothetical protein DPEC_G00278310 [Dallia pectoralis]
MCTSHVVYATQHPLRSVSKGDQADPNVLEPPAPQNVHSATVWQMVPKHQISNQQGSETVPPPPRHQTVEQPSLSTSLPSAATTTRGGFVFFPQRNRRAGEHTQSQTLTSVQPSFCAGE